MALLDQDVWTVNFRKDVVPSGKVNRKEYVCGKCKEVEHNARTCRNYLMARITTVDQADRLYSQ
ncbi:17125_t:CDS:2 [Funneliformis caledonium]|uniref:17125_t:CDS:1 n=1 Tax=Funneliformis caledonium TaxID=1117310 RepID=A0A9N9DKH8_9GLOM|nr:17125_t:CDS:2 [Funneliformis caledonium]